MDEYIKKQDLIDWCDETYKKQTNIKGKEYVNAFLQAVIICPTADVAPKCEVAREIFEEIEKMMLDGAIGGIYPAKVINPDKYAELKKKYTRKRNESVVCKRERRGLCNGCLCRNERKGKSVSNAHRCLRRCTIHRY